MRASDSSQHPPQRFDRREMGTGANNDSGEKVVVSAKVLGRAADHQIDAALTALEAHRWQATSATEEMILGKVRASMHKRVPAPNLLNDG